MTFLTGFLALKRLVELSRGSSICRQRDRSNTPIISTACTSSWQSCMRALGKAVYWYRRCRRMGNEAISRVRNSGRAWWEQQGTDRSHRPAPGWREWLHSARLALLMVTMQTSTKPEQIRNQMPSGCDAESSPALPGTRLCSRS